jgi:hypothetical protein
VFRAWRAAAAVPYAGLVVLTIRTTLQGRVARIWNHGQDVWALTLPALVALKLAGVIDWSWWWVLAPLWLSGLVAVPVLCVVTALILWDWHSQRS